MPATAPPPRLHLTPGQRWRCALLRCAGSSSRVRRCGLQVGQMGRFFASDCSTHAQNPSAAISSIVRPETTDRGSVATRSLPGFASASSIFTRSQASLFPVLNRVSAYPPLTFSPSSQTDTWPSPSASVTGTSCPPFRVRFR